jgi:hypothetical protein
MAAMDGQTTVREASRASFLPSQQSHERMAWAQPEFGHEQFRHQIVYVEKDRYSGSLEGTSREDDEVRHGVSLNEVEGTLAMVVTERAPGSQHKPAIVENIRQRVTAPVAAGKDSKYLDSIDHRGTRTSRLEAEDGHAMTSVGQRFGLAPNPGIRSVVRIRHHGYPAHAGTANWKVS